MSPTPSRSAATKPVRSSRAMRIGVLGGTFDPIHLGHLRSAEEIADAFRLDLVLFVPSANPPHKQGRVTDAAARLAMVRLALRGNRRFRASAIELRRAGRSYTIDTLRELSTKFPGADLHFIVGSDAFREIGSWREYAEIFAVSNVIVTSRPPEPKAPSLRAIVPKAIRSQFRAGSSAEEIVHRSGHTVRAQRIDGLQISSTDLRERVQHGNSIRYLVPESVASYIRTHALYEKAVRA